MGRRRKVLKRRLYTYEQLDAKHLTASRAGLGGAPLYGNVHVTYTPGRMQPGLCIAYVGKQLRVTFATVYRTRDGTLYQVEGIGQDRNNARIRKAIGLWERYVPAFTPYDGPRLHGGVSRRYLLLDGMVMQAPDRVGLWKTMPRAMVPRREKWGLGGGWNDFKNFENFPRRCRLFATRLRQSLEADGMGEVQLRNHHDWANHWHIIPSGNSLHVCTPPTDTQDGRKLVVHIAMHDPDSRSHHHVDGDFAIKHCQFLAIEHGKTHRDVLRWKCSRDAINGIREWIIDDIYIPGPG